MCSCLVLHLRREKGLSYGHVILGASVEGSPVLGTRQHSQHETQSTPKTQRRLPCPGSFPPFSSLALGAVWHCRIFTPGPLLLSLVVPSACVSLLLIRFDLSLSPQSQATPPTCLMCIFLVCVHIFLNVYQRCYHLVLFHSPSFFFTQQHAVTKLGKFGPLFLQIYFVFPPPPYPFRTPLPAC